MAGYNGANGSTLHKVEKLLPETYAEKLRTAESYLPTVEEHAAAMASNVRDVGSRFRRAVVASARREPMKTALVALALGVVLGRLWRS